MAIQHGCTDSSAVEQLCSATARLWKQRGHEPDPGPEDPEASPSSAGQLHSTLFCSCAKSSVFQVQPEESIFSGKCTFLNQRVAGLYKQKSPPWSLIGQNKATPIGWSCNLWLDAESLSPIGWNRTPATPLEKLALMAEMQSRQAGSSVWRLLGAVCGRGHRAETVARLACLSVSRSAT